MEQPQSRGYCRLTELGGWQIANGLFLYVPYSEFTVPRAGAAIGGGGAFSLALARLCANIPLHCGSTTHHVHHPRRLPLLAKASCAFGTTTAFPVSRRGGPSPFEPSMSGTSSGSRSCPSVFGSTGNASLCGKDPHVNPKTRRSFLWAGLLCLIAVSVILWAAPDFESGCDALDPANRCDRQLQSGF